MCLSPSLLALSKKSPVSLSSLYQTVLLSNPIVILSKTCALKLNPSGIQVKNSSILFILSG